jgi:hypothetical protein
MTDHRQARYDGAHDRYTSHVDRIAASLERLAAQVRQTGHLPVDAGDPGNGDPHVTAARDVVHEVAWGTAHLNLSTLLDAASAADGARRDLTGTPSAVALSEALRTVTEITAWLNDNYQTIGIEGGGLSLRGRVAERFGIPSDSPLIAVAVANHKPDSTPGGARP